MRGLGEPEKGTVPQGQGHSRVTLLVLAQSVLCEQRGLLFGLPWEAGHGGELARQARFVASESRHRF